MGKSGCEKEFHCQEQGRGVTLTPSPRGAALKIKIDDCLIDNQEHVLKCDCLYFYQRSQSKRYVFLVELKGNNRHHALAQLAATKNHSKYIELLNTVIPIKQIAIAIVSEKTKTTNRPSDEDWENEHNIRLKTIPIERDTTYDLKELLSK